MRLRVLPLVIVATVALVTSSVLAQPPASGDGRRGQSDGRMPDAPPGPMRIPIIAALDANADGALSAEEMASAGEALKKLDANGDGRLGREELFPQFRRSAPGGAGPERRRAPGAGQTAEMESTPLAKDDHEQRILQTIQNIMQKQGRRMNVPATDGRLLRLLTEAMGAKTVVEIGTSNGISAIWIGLALQKTGGKLITHEIDPQTAALARENFAAAGIADIVTVVEGDAHETVSKLRGPIDLVFLDADKQGYLDYLEKLLPLVRPGGLVLAHNMNPRMADPAFVKAITTNPELETLFYMQGAGMSVTLKKR